MPGATADCQLETDGLDTTYANDADGPIRGNARGQVFLARDLTITGLTVWRPAGYPSLVGAKLFITEVDTVVNYEGTGHTYAVPNTSKLLLNGPTIRVYDSDPPGHLIPMHFDIMPALVLPHPGQYGFFLQPKGCWQGQAWLLLVDAHNHYPHGIFWVTGDAISECYLPQTNGGADNVDFIFQIDYCKDRLTRVGNTSWGKLKLRYR